jgi:uncharacterized protein (TIGR01777 family)
MNILITGATGMIGQRLVRELIKNQQPQKGQQGNNKNKINEIYLLGRDRSKIFKTFEALKFVESVESGEPGVKISNILTWDELKEDKNLLSPIDLIIHLAGENIGETRWSEKQKQKIIKSRVESTALLAESCAFCAEKTGKKIRLLSASAIGIYESKANPENRYDEQSEIVTPPQSFLSSVAQSWENALEPAKKAEIPVTIMRFAVVLSETGGALRKMLPAFQWGLGGILGTGTQWFSWVSLHDLVRAVIFLIDHPEVTGVVNISAPEVMRQKEFAETLARTMHRPCVFKIPAWVLKLQFGEMAEELLLSGVAVKSERLKHYGFVFDDQTLTQALEKILLIK